MTINAWLLEAQQTLRANGIDSARIDSLLLLEYSLGLDRAHILANPDVEISPENIRNLNNVFRRRLKHEPIAYIRGYSEFYGYNFLVNSNVLIPRPESESFINVIKTLYSNYVNINSPSKSQLDSHQRWSIADIGTGCGAIGISVKLELPDMSVDLVDIDSKALTVAKTNVDKFTLNISIIESDLIASLANSYDVLLCNLPYVPDDYEINQAAKFEPKIALFGGSDGLNIYRKLFKQLLNRSNMPLYILYESLLFQHETLAKIAAEYSYHLVKTDGLVQAYKHN